MATASPFIDAMGESATLKTRAQGARDAVTQWPVVTYTDSTIKILVDHNQSTIRELGGERVSHQVLRGFIKSSITVTDQDRVVYHGETYLVEGLENVEYHLGDASYKSVTLVRLTE